MDRNITVVQVIFETITDENGSLAEGMNCKQTLSINGDVVYRQETEVAHYAKSDHPIRVFEKFLQNFEEAIFPGEITENI